MKTIIIISFALLLSTNFSYAQNNRAPEVKLKSHTKPDTEARPHVWQESEKDSLSKLAKALDEAREEEEKQIAVLRKYIAAKDTRCGWSDYPRSMGRRADKGTGCYKPVNYGKIWCKNSNFSASFKVACTGSSALECARNQHDIDIDMIAFHERDKINQKPEAVR